MKNLVLCFFILLSGNAVWGQTIHGHVSEMGKDGQTVPVPFVNVIWKGTPYGVQADFEGHFELKVYPGHDTLIVNHLGYAPFEMKYTGEPELEIILYPTGELNAVEIEKVVGGTHINLLDAQLSQKLNEKELCKAACCNLSESFETNARYRDWETDRKSTRLNSSH